MTDEAPVNLEAEQALLGAVLVNNEAFYPCDDILGPEHFSEDVHGRIWNVITRLIHGGKVADPVKIKIYFENDPGLEDVGGVKYLARLAGSAVSVISAPDYARTIRSHADSREMITIGHDLIAGSTQADIDETPDMVRERAEDALHKLKRGTHKDGRLLHIGDISSQGLQELAEIREHGLDSVGLSSGLETFDNACNGGLRSGNLCIIAGRPGMGKTTLLTNIARGVAGARKGVLFFSMESPAKELYERIISDMTHDFKGERCPYADVPRNGLDDAQWARWQTLSDYVGTLPLYIATGKKTIPQMAMTARRVRREFENEGRELCLVIADYMQLIRGSQMVRKQGRYQEMTEVTGDAKEMALELELPILAAAQLSRKVEERHDKRPMLSDLRESGSIEQDADLVIFPYRAEYYQRKNEPSDTNSPEWTEWRDKLRHVADRMDLIVAKNRHGPEGTKRVVAHMAYSALRDIASADL